MSMATEVNDYPIVKNDSPSIISGIVICVGSGSWWYAGRSHLKHCEASFSALLRPADRLSRPKADKGRADRT